MRIKLPQKINLHGNHVRLRAYKSSLLSFHGLSGTGLFVNALEVDFLSGLLGKCLGFLVVLDTVQEIVTALGVLDVLHTHIDTLGDDSSFTTLFTRTPTLDLVTLKMIPVRPW